jgi:hypothetical protein
LRELQRTKAVFFRHIEEKDIEVSEVTDYFKKKIDKEINDP